jgi:hypothetical protein
MNIFLDDWRTPLNAADYMHNRIGQDNLLYVNREWCIVQNEKEMIRALDLFGMPELISFDHDLREGNGLDCMRTFYEFCIAQESKPKKFFIHSETFNEEALKSMFEIKKTIENLQF